jgi:hypothetical protein
MSNSHWPDGSPEGQITFGSFPFLATWATHVDWSFNSPSPNLRKSAGPTFEDWLATRDATSFAVEMVG